MKEDNELIAKFHGWESHARPHGQYSKTPLWSFPAWGKAAYTSESFLYHSSWDWLMPVVEKISQHIYDEEEVDDGIEKKGNQIHGLPENIRDDGQ